MQDLVGLIEQNEDWLIRRLLFYAKRQDYTKYTSTLEEAWRMSIRGLSDSIVKGIRCYKDIPQLGPDDDYQNDPMTSFGVVEARRHRSRGVTLSMFLGLMKYYRQSYLDLLEENVYDVKDWVRKKLFLERCFDRIEISFSQEWARSSDEEMIAELQTANRRMTNEKNAYLTAFESLNDPVIMLDREERIINLNIAAGRLIDPEYDPGESYYHPDIVRQSEGNVESPAEPVISDRLIGRRVHEVFPWLDEQLQELYKHSDLSSSSPCRAIIDSCERFFEVKISNMLDVSEKYTAIVVSMHEVTDLKKVERALIEREANLSSIIRVAPVGIGLVVDRVIQRVNSRLCEMLGYSSEELINQDARMLYPSQEEYERVGREKYAQIKEDGTGTIETLWKRKDGEIIDVLLSSTPLDTADLGAGVTFTALDITERKQVEIKLLQAMDELGQSNADLQHFASIASHDLREPLRMVSSYVKLLRDKYKGKLDEDADEFIHFAVDGAERMQALIDDLLVYSRVGTKGSTFKPIGCNKVLDIVMKNLEVTIEENEADVGIEKLPEIMGDESQFVQLFQNLIANAIKFRGEDPPRIHISARKSGDEWVFAVKDNGIGIASKYSEKVFEIFRRLHTTSEYSGTGVGLAICQRIVQRHGGRIWVESQEHFGSAFYFTIPFREVSYEQPEEQRSEAFQVT